MSRKKENKTQLAFSEQRGHSGMTEGMTEGMAERIMLYQMGGGDVKGTLPGE